MGLMNLDEIAKRETFTREEIKTILEATYDSTVAGKEIAKIIFPKEAQGFARGMCAGITQVQEIFGFLSHHEAINKMK